MVISCATLLTNGYQEGGAMTTEHRIRELELGYEELSDRLARLERQTPRPDRPPTPATARPAPVPPAPSAAFPPAAPPPPQRSRPLTKLNFEDLLGGRILALIGGAAIVLAGAFFFALAVSNGWIGEGARTLMAAAGSLGLLAFGMWLHERRGRTF